MFSRPSYLHRFKQKVKGSQAQRLRFPPLTPPLAKR